MPTALILTIWGNAVSRATPYRKLKMPIKSEILPRINISIKNFRLVYLLYLTVFSLSSPFFEISAP